MRVAQPGSPGQGGAPARAKIEQIAQGPGIGKRLERELTGYLSCRASRYRIIFNLREKERTVEIHYVGHRKDIYELLGEQIRKG